MLSCVTTLNNLTYAYAYFLLPIILTLFGYLTSMSVKQLSKNLSRQNHFHRMERQLTSLLIAHTIVCIITSLPYGVQYLYIGITLNQSKDSYRLAVESFIQHVVRLKLYASSAASFYVYICLSSEIRRMTIDILLCRLSNIKRINPSQTMERTICQTAIEMYKIKPTTQIQS